MLQHGLLKDPINDLPLTRQFFRHNLITCALALGAAMLLCLSISVYLTQKDMRSDLHYKTITLAGNIADSLQSNHLRGMQNVVLNAIHAPELQSITVFDKNGAAILAWKSEGQLINTEQIANTTLVDATQIIFRRLQMSAETPIISGSTMDGKLLVQISSWPLYRHALVLLLCGTVLTLIIAPIAAHRLTRRQLLALTPVLTLSTVAERVATLGDYSLRAEQDKQHELGNLVMHFNLMLARMEAWENDMQNEARERRETESRITILENHDALTKLPNRYYFHQLMTNSMEEAISHHQMMALMFIDLDHFRALNASFDCDTGDVVLTIMASRLCKVLRTTDTLCRVGADEFAAILPQAGDLATVTSLAERLIDAIQQPVILRGKDIIVTASIGIACCPLHAHDQRQFLKCADLALKAAKTAGRNTWRLYDGNLSHHGVSPDTSR